jgi:hypothetical protein
MVAGFAIFWLCRRDPNGSAGTSLAALFYVRFVLVVIACSAWAPQAARADDGVYVTESFGVGMGRGDLAEPLGHVIHARLAAGMRVGYLAVEPWMLAELQDEREGGLRGFVGGDPVDGRADLDAYGVDARVIAPLASTPTSRLEAYVRGGPFIASGTGALAGYHGRGAGVAGGVQITGRVRALGFLWAPLLFVKRGPLATGAIYLDQGYDFYELQMAGARPIRARVGHVSFGFSIGSSF